MRECWLTEETMTRASWRVRWRSSAAREVGERVVRPTLTSRDVLVKEVSCRVMSMAETRSCGGR